MKQGVNLKSHLAMLVLLLAMLYTSRAGKVCVDRDASGAEIQQDYAPDEIIVKFKNTVADTLEEQRLDDSNLAQLELPSSVDKLNKKFHLRNIRPMFKNFKANRERLKAVLKKDKALLTKQEKRILQRLKRADKRDTVPDLDRIYKLQFDLAPDQSIRDVLTAYKNDPSVEYAELNYIVSIHKATTNDTLYSLQWPLNNVGQTYPESGYYNPPPGTYDCDIDSPEAWDVDTGSPSVVVAVVDTGVDYDHRDLQDNIWINEAELNGITGVDDDGNEYVDDIYGYDFVNYDGDPIDDHGHGTHCSGIIAARGNNGLDISGVCWDTGIMAVKYLDAGGEGYTSNAVAAVYYAVENGADIISCSWGGGGYSETLKEAIDYAYSQGVIIVASSGNDYSDYPQYPAYYEHVISVAATNSNDEKASFSNYGDWVDLAAPGVDILSLRAHGTSIGTVYDDYTTVQSGTSMACPHVAGACALLLSADPALTVEDINGILMITGDSISPGVCRSNGRLNLLNALLRAKPSRGYINLDDGVYSCASIVSIRLADRDLDGAGSQEVTIVTSGGDIETVSLTETPLISGVFNFTGTISTDSGDASIEDGILQLSNNEVIIATYEDQNDGTGNPVTATDTAITDCKGPVVFNLQLEARSIEARITFETDEPTTGRVRVRCGLACGGPYTIVVENPELSTVHTIRLTDLTSETTYYFVVDANDSVGNQTTDDNGGACSVFTTEPLRVLRVPGEFLTIQAAIDSARDWGGDTVLVADGNYAGSGNRDIDFKGKAITVCSKNGPENCIIDCQGTETKPHRGFYFHSGEGQSSILDGFIITNGYVNSEGGDLYYKGGGIYCTTSSPMVVNCIFRKNSAKIGGGMYNDGRDGPCNPALANCIFSGNSAIWSGGGMYNCRGSNPILTNCSFINNSAAHRGGGMYNGNNRPTLINCIFSGNSAESSGGGMENRESSPTIMNCTFSGNSGYSGGGMYNYYNSNPTLTNCTFIGNTASENMGGGMYNGYSSPAVTNCTFSNNRAEGNGGGMKNRRSNPTVTDCTFTNNSAAWGGGMHSDLNSNPMVTYCRFIDNVAGGGGGIGNAECSAILANCMFSGNSAIYGGGMRNYISSPILEDCRFSGNTASEGGGGMYNEDKSSPTLTNCTFAANFAPNGNALACDSYQQKYPSSVCVNNCILWDGGNEIWNNDNSVTTITYSDVYGGWPGKGNIDADPCFIEPGYWADANDTNIAVEPGEPNAVWLDGDYHLLPGSRCINAGDPNYIAEPNEKDLDGKPRIIGCQIDMGAYEYGQLISAEVRIVPRTINLASKGKWLSCSISLPEDYNVADIDSDSILLECEIEPESLHVDELAQLATARFTRQDVQPILEVGYINLKITGQLTDGTVFEATDEIRIMDKGSKK